MKYFWITLSLLTALAIGCNSGTTTEDPASEDGSANVTTDGETDSSGADDMLDLPPMDETELASTSGTGSDSSETPDATGSETGEFVQEDIRGGILKRVQAALQERDVATAITIIEEGLQKIPDDADMAKSLIVLRVQNDMLLANEGEKDVALASMKETEAAINTVLGEDPDLPTTIWQLFHINQARRHAHAGDIENTIAALEQANANGFDQFAAVTADPFFEGIEDNDGFQAAIDGLQKKATELKLAKFESFDFDFELTDLAGNPIKLADYAGKVVIVDIWGTWCPPCKQEIPHFVQLQETYKDDLAIVGVTYERHDAEEQAMAGIYKNEENRAEVVQRVAAFAKEQGINYTLALGDMQTQQLIPDLQGFPTTLFIDRGGKVRLMVVGYHPQEQLERYVTALLTNDA